MSKVKRLVGLQVRCGWLREISTLLEFDFLTVQPVASRYTVYAIPARRDRLRVQKFMTKGGAMVELDSNWLG